jgi:FtsH-binding integral membrane protein
MGPFLFGALIALMMTGFVGIFLPFSRTMDLIFAIGGCLIFSGYVVYDTYIINKRLSPDEYIMGAISLYLEYVFSVAHWTVADMSPFLSFINLCKVSIYLSIYTN